MVFYCSKIEIYNEFDNKRRFYIILDKNQLVVIKWNNTNKEWYESKGYVYTKRYDEVYVKAKDLKPNSSARVIVNCDYCGSEYDTEFAVLNSGRKILPKDACKHCASLKTNDINFRKRATKAFSIAEEICKKNDYKLLTNIDEYTNIFMKIKFICSQHGLQIMSLDNFIHGHKCRECSYEKRGIKLKFSIDYVKDTIESINGNILLNPEDYKDTICHNLDIRCSCGNIFTTSFSNYKRCGVNKCFSCSNKESNYEKKIKEYLIENNIDFIQEKRFSDCRDKKPLPFDFFIPSKKLIIEYDGQQHFYPVFGNDSFKMTIKHDKIKNEYCKMKNINLLRIPYWNRSKFKKIIDQQIC